MAEPDVGALAAEVVDALRRAGTTVATAESLTGGLLGAALTSVPGSSAAYRGGVVSYATDLKHQLLGVDPGLLAERGAVDPDVAAAMATGVRLRLGADHGVATTGVAGPDPQDGRPVGTVWVAVASASGVDVVDASLDASLDASDRDASDSDASDRDAPTREQVRALTVVRALGALLHVVRREAAGPVHG